MFKGSIVALVTPFNAQGAVDFKNLSALIEWHVASGTDAIVLCGTTGEAPTLSFEEKVTLFEEGVRAAKGRIPIIAGTGTYDTLQSVQLTREAALVGVAGALIVLPYYSRPTAEGCFLHFQELSKVGLPLIVYHHPGRTGIKLSTSSLARLSELPHVVAIKDATGDVDDALEWMHRGSSVPLLCGDDSGVVPWMALGASGVISIIANILPQQWKILTSLLLEDRVSEGREFFNLYYPLVKAMVLETNPQCVKYALSAMGRCSSHLRLPLIQPQESVKQRIASEMANVGLLDQQSFTV
jgi:4-hydroxy-tetrahydrodipicolinate synthase